MSDYWKEVAEKLIVENGALQLKLMQVESDLELYRHIAEDRSKRVIELIDGNEESEPHV